MSKQIEKLMAKYPQVFYEVSYEGNGFGKWGDPTGDGTWLYMRPGWYCCRADTGTIHEHTIKGVLDCAREAYQDKGRWESENPDATDEIVKMMAGDYDKD